MSNIDLFKGFLDNTINNALKDHPGVYPLKPVFTPWHLDKAGNNRIRRFGFQLVPDFSGTAHSYVGYILKAALADCLAWDATPNRDHMFLVAIHGELF